MATPSIKGATISKLVEDVHRLLDEGAVPPEEVEAYLDTEALALLDAKFNDAGWYPLAVYEQYALLLLEMEGKGNLAYLRERGYRTGDRLVKSGLYQQFEFLGRRDRPRDYEAFFRDLRLITSLSGALVNVGRWSAERDPEHPERAMVLGRNLEGYPEVLGISTAGFLTGISAHAHTTGIERPSPRELSYRMDRDFSELG